LTLSVLLTAATPGTPEFIILAGLVAVLAGVLQLAMGLARLGVLVNFVSHSVIVGFTTAAGVLIAVRQIRILLGLEFTSHSLPETLHGVATHLPETHTRTFAMGLATILLIVFLRRLNPKLPAPLISMVVAALGVRLLGLDQQGVAVIGELPRSLPPLAKLPILDLEMVAQMATGALAVAAIGLVEATSIARSLSSQTGQRLDSNQEFVGQGLANIACGLLSGYPCSGSFTRSAVNHDAGARTPLASAVSGLFVLIAMLVLAPFTAYVPSAALAGVLLVTAYGMIDKKEIARIWRGARPDAVIMLVTFLGTLFLHLEFAVLMGILLSFAIYILKTSVPQVSPVLPDASFKHFYHQPQKPQCPQLGILEILGDLYFGAVSHIEEAVHQHLNENPDQRFLLLRMYSAHQCDFTGIHALESIVRTCRERGGDVFIVRAQEPVLDLMKSTGFFDDIGADHFLAEDTAISTLFYKIIDPAVCIYECPVRAFYECQNLPKQLYQTEVPFHTEIPTEDIIYTSSAELWQRLHDDVPPLVIDVREPREFRQGHVPQAKMIPLPQLLADGLELPRDRTIVLVCRGGRRSTRAAFTLREQGHDNVVVLQGGMLSWESAGLLDAIGE
jgi:SulP family sulfate permease